MTKRRPSREGSSSSRSHNHSADDDYWTIHIPDLPHAAKHWLGVAANATAIVLSIGAIYSCNFFSYDEKDAAAMVSYEPVETDAGVLTYEPFEYLPAAGVGLFRYYLGDPAAPVPDYLQNVQLCYYYCDEATDYQWLSSNTRATGHGNVDVWLVARICSILAPIAGGLALVPSLLKHVWTIDVWAWCGSAGGFAKAQWLIIAALFQLGTFLVLFATPVMYSTAAHDQTRQFCFSATSTVQCRIDSGAVLSFAAAILYLVLAFASFRTKGKKDRTNEREKMTTNKTKRTSKSGSSSQRLGAMDPEQQEPEDHHSTTDGSTSGSDDGAIQRTRTASTGSVTQTTIGNTTIGNTTIGHTTIGNTTTIGVTSDAGSVTSGLTRDAGTVTSTATTTPAAEASIASVGSQPQPDTVRNLLDKFETNVLGNVAAAATASSNPPSRPPTAVVDRSKPPPAASAGAARQLTKPANPLVRSGRSASGKSVGAASVSSALTQKTGSVTSGKSSARSAAKASSAASVGSSSGGHATLGTLGSF